MLYTHIYIYNIGIYIYIYVQITLYMPSDPSSPARNGAWTGRSPRLHLGRWDVLQDAGLQISWGFSGSLYGFYGISGSSWIIWDLMESQAQRLFTWGIPFSWKEISGSFVIYIWQTNQKKQQHVKKKTCFPIQKMIYKCWVFPMSFLQMEGIY